MATANRTSGSPRWIKKAGLLGKPRECSSSQNIDPDNVIMTPARAATLVYVGNADSNDINVLSLDPKSGDLTAVETVAVPGIIKASW